MKASSRILALCLLPLGMCGVALAQQTLQFTNTTPPVQVTLSPSSTLGIAANGNVTASCVLDAQNADRCQGMPAGGGGSGNGPTVGLTASYSAPADANNEYPAGTIVTLTPTVVGNPAPAEACVQVLVAGPGDSGWGGTAMLPPFGARQATVNTPDATYQFRLRCFSPGGVGESAVITVNTQPGIPPPPGDDCTAEQQAAADASHPGYTRASAPDQFTDLIRLTGGGNCSDFPNTGTFYCMLLTQRNKYVSLRFTAPSDPGVYPLDQLIRWQAAQTGGQADETATYFSISRCQGDFRIPTSGTAPPGDSTLSHGCRNIRFLNGLGNPPNVGLGIAYNITGVSDTSRCGIQLGGVYYFNMILADPRGGIQEGENTCNPPSLNQCGVQLRAP